MPVRLMACLLSLAAEERAVEGKSSASFFDLNKRPDRVGGAAHAVGSANGVKRMPLFLCR